MLQQVLGMLSEEHGLVALEAPTDLQHAADEERVDFVKAEIERRAEALRDALDLYDDEIYSPVPLLVRTKPVDGVEVIERQRKALITNYLPPVALARNNSVPGLGVSHQAEADPVQSARESTGLPTPARFPKINSVPGLGVSHQAEANPVQTARESTGLPTPARFPKPEARVPAPEPLAEVAEDSDFDDPTSPSCSPPSSPPEAASPPASGLHHRVTQHWNAYMQGTGQSALPRTVVEQMSNEERLAAAMAASMQSAEIASPPGSRSGILRRSPSSRSDASFSFRTDVSEGEGDLPPTRDVSARSDASPERLSHSGGRRSGATPRSLQRDPSFLGFTWQQDAFEATMKTESHRPAYVRRDAVEDIYAADEDSSAYGADDMSWREMARAQMRKSFSKRMNVMRWEYWWEYGLGGFMFWKDRLPPPRASATYDSPEEEVDDAFRTLSQRARRKEELKQQTLIKRARYSFRQRQKAIETDHERMPCWKQYFVLFVGSCIVAACTVASITLFALTPPLQQYFALASYFGSVPLSFLSHFGVRYIVRQLRKHAALWRGRFVEGQFRKVRVQAAAASKRWTSEEDEAAKRPKPKVWKVPDRRLAVESVDPSATAESPPEKSKRRGVAFAVLPAGAAENEKRPPLRINRMASAYLDNSMLDQTQSLAARKGDGFAQMDRSSETIDGRPRMTRVMSRANLMMGAQIRPFFSTFGEQKDKEEDVNPKPRSPIGPDFDFGPVNRAPSKGTAGVRGRKLVAQKGHGGSQKLSEEALISGARPLRRRGSLGPASPPQVSSSVSSAAGTPTSPSQHL